MSWLEVAEDSDFSIDNLPFGVFSVADSHPPRCATRVGDTVVDLSVLQEAGLFDTVDSLQANVFCQPTLNAFCGHARPVWRGVRARLVALLKAPTSGSQTDDDALRTNVPLQKAAFHDISQVQLHLPVQVGDYTDFYASRYHAEAVGRMFRGPQNALPANWLHLPIGYHGRASTVTVSPTAVVRPCGQLPNGASDRPSRFGPTQKLDFELEVAAVVGGPANPMGMSIGIKEAEERIFGYLLLNDWSARDVQKWEYVPLGPFGAKNFCTTVSAWIVPQAALQDAKGPSSGGTIQDDPTPLPYLQDAHYATAFLNVPLTVQLHSAAQRVANLPPTVLSRSNLHHLYWHAGQQLVHHAVTGCSLQPGDLLGSGTISGPLSPDHCGSLLESSQNGSKPVSIGGDEVRSFLQDGDTVILTGSYQAPGKGRVGFGTCTGTILPAQTSDCPAAPPPVATDDHKDNDEYKDFVLHGYWASSATWRVRLALAYKGIPYTIVPVNLDEGEQKTEAYRAKNPLGQVPTLEFCHAKTGEPMRLAQSIAIVDFLDTVFCHRRSLIPKDPFDKAVAWEMVEVINAGTQPLQNRFFLKELEERSQGLIVAKDQAKRVIEKGLAALETLVQRRRKSSPKAQGPFCLGTFSPTIADVCLVPQMENARKFGVAVEELCPTLTEMDRRFAQLDWTKAAHPTNQPDAPAWK